MLETIKNTIESSLEGSVAYVTNPQGDSLHFEAVVVFKDFETLSLIQQHQLVMNSLHKHFDRALHALKLTTLTPMEFEKIKKEKDIYE